MGEREGSCRVVLRIAHEAWQDIVKAIQPDNVVALEWLKIDCKGFEGVVECVVEIDCSTPSRILSLRNTLDDLLRAVRVVVEVVEGSMKVKKA